MRQDNRDQSESLINRGNVRRSLEDEFTALKLETTGVELDLVELDLSGQDGLDHTSSDALALVIRINRPHARNALDLNAIRALHRVASALSRLTQARERSSTSPLAAVILTGAGGHFIAGGDLKALHDQRSATLASEMSTMMCEVSRELRGLPCPLIIAAEGYAIGGGAEVLLMGDLCVLSSESRVRFAQVSLGLSAGWGGSERLAALIGPRRALALMLSAEVLSAERCLNIGIAHRLSAPGEALEDSLAWAAELALVPHAVSAMKSIFTSEGGEIRAREQERFPKLWESEEHWRAVDRLWARRASSRRAEDLKSSGQEVLTQCGQFIVLEGIDGAGTTTQAHHLKAWIEANGGAAHVTNEPSTGTLGELTRRALRGEALGHGGRPLHPESLALLFAADRADHWHNEIAPLLEANIHVICDRYLYSSLAYQGLEVPEAWVKVLNERFPPPDALLFIEVEPRLAAERRSARGLEPDRYEVDALQIQIAERYQRICHEARAIVIDGAQSVEEVSADCREALRELLNIPS